MLLSLSLDTNSTLEYIKYTIEKSIENKTLQLPYEATKRIQELLIDENITKEKFLMELRPILARTDNFDWKTQVFFKNLADKVFDPFNSLSFVQLSIYIFFVFFFLFLYKKFNKNPKFKRLKKKVNSIFKSVLVRFGALMGYLVPYAHLCHEYIPSISSVYPLVNIFVAPPMNEIVTVISNFPHSSTIYFFGAIYICLRRRIPKNRFVRFHVAKGLMLLSVQAIPLICYEILTSQQFRNYGNTEVIQNFLFVFLLNIFWLLPGVWEALTLSYPKNPLLREAVEVNLGPDDFGNFKWWDR